MAKASLAIALTDVAQAADSPSKPNFLFILIDDMGAHDLSNEGSEFYESPNVDRIASEGIIVFALDHQPDSTLSRPYKKLKTAKKFDFNVSKPHLDAGFKKSELQSIKNKYCSWDYFN